VKNTPRCLGVNKDLINFICKITNEHINNQILK
jgi:hypothetical protein